MDENSLNYYGLDLTKNGVIEASAGTGKTYTLVEITIKYILDAEIDIKNIVLLTFTKAAATEMKSRIRAKLRELLKVDSQNKLLQNAYRSLDEALITTIHSFCKHIINQYPFETQGIKIEEIDNNKGWKLLLIKDYLRSIEDSFDLFLADGYRIFCTMIKPSNNSFDSIFKELLDFCQLPYPTSIYSPNDETILKIKDLNQEFIEKKSVIYSTLENIKNIDITKIDINSILQENLDKRITINIKAFIEKLNDTTSLYTLNIFYQYVKNISWFSSIILNEKKLDKIELLPGIAKNFCIAIKNFLLETSPYFEPTNKKENSLYEGVMISYFLKNIIPLLKKHLEEKQNGCYSFQDLLLNVNQLLQDSPTFKNILQKNYKVAIIDEFQDTDYLQWQILQTIFSHKVSILVGDSKQSIYRFSGANPHVYEQAKKQTTSFNYLELNQNFRSNINVIDSVNHWFKELLANFTPSILPQKDKNHLPPPCIFYEQQPYNKTTFINLQELEDNDENTIYHAYAKEICYLLSNKKITISEKGNEARALLASDFAILMNNNDDLKELKKILSQYNISAVLLTNDSIYKSEQADFMLKLLFVLSRPIYLPYIKELLLSPLFSLNINDLEKYSLEKYANKCLEWQKMAKNGQWAIMLSDVLSISGYLERELESKNSYRDRNYSNVKQVLDIIVKIAGNKKNYIKNLYHRWANLVLEEDINTSTEEERPLLESDQNSVKLMTIHKSKGLEFNIVFIIPPSEKTKTRYYCKMDEKNEAQIDFLCLENNTTTITKLNYEESKRLFYVALTRAKAKIYLPFTSFKKPNYYSNLLIDLLASDNLRDNQKAGSAYHLEKNSANLNSLIEATINFLENNKLFCLEPIKKIAPLPASKLLNSGQLNYQTFNVQRDFWHECPVQSSYSSLVKFITHTYEDETTINKNDDDDNIDFGSIDIENVEYLDRSLYPELYLPRGATTGNLLHQVLEKLDFTIATLNLETFRNNEVLNALINKHWPFAYQNNDVYKDRLKIMIWHSLNQPIFNNFALKDLNMSATKREMPFLIYIDKDKRFGFNNLGDNIVIKAGYLKGIIDLVFEYNNKIYILDWKSSSPSSRYIDYDTHLLINYMKSEKYHFQYYIYLYAIYLYGKTLKENFSYENDIGGVIYVFNRATHASFTDGRGFFIDKPSEQEFNQFVTIF